MQAANIPNSGINDMARELAKDISWCFKHFTPDEIDFVAGKLEQALRTAMEMQREKDAITAWEAVDNYIGSGNLYKVAAVIRSQPVDGE